MERALDLQVFIDALGEHEAGVLPTAEQLVGLIANVEIMAVANRHVIDEQMLRAAWYLHAVASAGGEQYPLTRRSQAFAVSAHIFDLATEQPGRSRVERLSLTFASQVGYRRAGLDPNATAMFRRSRELLLTGDLQAHLHSLALEAGVAFLGLDSGFLLVLLRTWRQEFAQYADGRALDGLLTTMFGPAEQVVHAVSAMHSFLRMGGSDQLGLARAALRLVINGSAGLGDLDARWVAAHLLAIVDDLEVGSVRALMPPGAPPAVAQAFCVSDPAVLTLWPPQRELLQRVVGNPLDDATRHLLLSMPTSAGKTLLAQLVICTHVGSGRGGVCYVSPLRSLGREMRASLLSRLRVLDKELGSDLPETSPLTDPFSLESDGADVDIFTPERLMNVLRRDPETILSRYSLFVIDEAQLLAQPGRGFLLEGLLALLTMSTAAPRIVLLSGVLGNASALASWLDPTSSGVLYTSQWRGPRRLHAVLNTRALWDSTSSAPRRSKDWPVRLSTPLVGHLRIRPTSSGPTTALSTPLKQPLGQLVRRQSSDGYTTKRLKESTASYRMFAQAAVGLLHAGSLLMVMSTRTLAKSAAAAMAEELPETNRTLDLNDFLQGRLGEGHPLLACVRKGIAFHHAALPVDVQEAVEEALRTGVLDAVVSTSTLTEGVNLPVRTVVVAETLAGTGAPPLDPARILNAVGRAGRAGRETEGWIVLALAKQESPADFDALQPSEDDLEVRSTLLSDSALDSLADAEALIAATADGLLAVSPGPASEFVSYCWFVLCATADLQDVLTSNDVGAAVQRLLGYEQLGPDVRARWMALARQVEELHQRTDVPTRRRYLISGTSLGTAAALDALVARLVTALNSRSMADGVTFLDAPVQLSLTETLDFFDKHGVLSELLSLPEADRCWTFPGVSAPPNVSTALRLWLAGSDMPALAAVMFPDLVLGKRLEHTVDAVSRAFEHYFSWTLGTLLELVNTSLAGAGSVLTLRSDLAFCVRYGVDTPYALRLLTHGVRSRRLASRIGSAARAVELPLDQLRPYLAKQHIQGWRTNFDASPRELLDLLEFTRSRRSSLLRQLLEVGVVDVPLSIGSLPGVGIGDSSGYNLAEYEAGPASTYGDDADDSGIAVLLSQTSDDAEIHVKDQTGTTVATIAAGEHADVVAVLASGLDIYGRLVGSQLRLLSREFRSYV